MAKGRTPAKASPAARKTRAPARAARPTPLAGPVRPTTPAATFTSKPVDISFAGPTHRLARADLQIDGIFHGEASYRGFVFLNNAKADANTPRTQANGYAGAFSIFGHGGCVGDPGHCEVKGTKRDPNDLRYPHPLTLAAKTIEVTDTLKAIALSASEATITIVPVVSAANPLCDTKNVFRCERMRLVSYDP